MKKITYIMFALLAVTISASADENPVTFNWAHSIDGNTKSGDNIIAMCKSSDGSYFVASSFGSSTNAEKYPEGDAQTCKFDGETMTYANGNEVKGSAYTGTTHASNLVLQKVAADGTVTWTSYATFTDMLPGESHMAATSDGGVVLALKIYRSESEDIMSYWKPTATAEESVSNSSPKKNTYFCYVLKIKSDGTLSSKRPIFSTDNTKTNPIYINSITVGNKDSIFVSGNYRAIMKIGSQTFTPKNVENWDGDSQKNVGDAFIIGMTSTAMYKTKLMAEGSADFACFDKMTYNNGTLYLNGRVQNASGMTLGGKEVNASGDNQTEIFASVSAGKMSVNYVKALTSVANNKDQFVLQNKGVQYLDGKLYYTGSINGSWAQDGTTILDNASTGQLRPYVLQVDPETGTVEKAAVRTEGSIGNFYGVYVGEKNYLYAYGYDMTSGAILAPINKESYEVSSPIVLCKYGTVADATQPIVDGKNLIMANRGGNGSSTENTATFYGTDKSFTGLNYWGSVYYSYTINDVDNPTGISENIAAPESATVDVYTIGGIRVKSGVSANEATQGLTKGIYIIGNKKVVVK